ncbi:MAG: hypothetical protein COV29_04585 [Candidatus Yanofskybacteria bacterium CG10_big_fil_rev_8_21_14_0_10_36_16]|uniref:Clp R domain-containing protein n=1 Tax=Candidatus Yanofskybacteria bacterium CG10_big_fil_rev_8_21_14_0_10_36_16 TaxID=1975096 RepID=A0A2J0Q6V3_9BACT|nr:MAG: hypothetical protein COV29_04585 [Candidatus Yanofskybacteria bacterium CG10_big_fil_rev_8_21_14_0_10_36_16]
MYFNLKSSKIYKPVEFYKTVPAGVLKFFRITLLVLGVVSLVIFLSVLIVQRLAEFAAVDIEIGLISSLNSDIFYGLAMIFLPLAFSIIFFEIFIDKYLKNPLESSNIENIADFLDFNAASVFADTLALSQSLNEEKISTDSLLAAVLDDPFAKEVFTRLGLDAATASEGVKKIMSLKIGKGAPSFFGGAANLSQDLSELLLHANKLRGDHGGKKITVVDLVASLFDYNPIFKKFMLDIGIDGDDLVELVHWYEQIWSFRENKKSFWRLENLLRKPPIGRSWTYGYSWRLSHFASNLSDQLKLEPHSLILFFRKREIEQIEQILVRSGENNVLLVGQEGVGKRTTILDFVRLINKGKALPALNYKKVFELNISTLASLKDEADIQTNLTQMLDEAVKAGNIILVIEDFHNYIGEKGGLGRIDVTQVLMPYLESSKIQIIATTDPVSFRKSIASRSGLMKVFEKVDITEPDKDQTTRIVEESLPFIEKVTKSFVTYGALKSAVESSDKYIQTSPFPDKALNLLSEAVSYALADRRKIVTIDDINEVVTRKTNIKVGPVNKDEKEKLINLEKIMHKEIIGQDRAVETVASAMRRLRTGMAGGGKPAGVFLFVGPTGVGKTLTSKILSKVYFGSEDKMIRFDMSEYQDIESLDRFLGSLRLSEPGQFVTQVRENPFSLILLDELEKAHPDILNIFLQVFDEGRLTDAFGQKVNFENNIIIATSNAGAEFIRDMVGKNIDPSEKKAELIDVLLKEGHFRPEFVNRFDEVVVFHPLTREQVKQISALLLNKLAKRLKDQGYEYLPTQDVVEYVSKIGFDPQFGARPMQRAIQDKVENVIAKKILDGEIEKGKEFKLSASELGE